ncbi:MAG: Lrp/AsnC family transcriptional regulator [Nakamurella sp.]
MDMVDRRLVDALRYDGRASYAELARLVGLSSSAVHERVSKLEATGVITGFRAIVNPHLVGMGVTALVGIEPGENGRDEVIAAALEAIPEVESCYGVAGDEAFVVQVRVASVDHLHRCIGELRAIDGVARTRTTVVLATRFEHRPTRDTDTPTRDAGGS